MLVAARSLPKGTSGALMGPDEDTRETPNRPLSRKALASPLGGQSVSHKCLCRDTFKACVEPRPPESRTGVREVTLESTWRDSSETSIASGHTESPARRGGGSSGARLVVSGDAGGTPVSSAGDISGATRDLGFLAAWPSLCGSHPASKGAGTKSLQAGHVADLESPLWGDEGSVIGSLFTHSARAAAPGGPRTTGAKRKLSYGVKTFSCPATGRCPLRLTSPQRLAGVAGQENASARDVRGCEAGGPPRIVSRFSPTHMIEE